MSDKFSDDVCRGAVPAVQAAGEAVGPRSAVEAADLAAGTADRTSAAPGAPQPPSPLQMQIVLAARYGAAIHDWEKAVDPEEQRLALAEAQRLWAVLARLRGQRLAVV